MIDWDAIVAEYGPMVWQTAYRLLGRVDDTQDCLQETFLAALKLSRRQRVRNWPALLRRLVTARALDRLRRRVRASRRRDEGKGVETLAQQQANPDQSIRARELAGRLREALPELPGREAQVFALHVFEQMSRGDIAKALGLPTNAVGVLLHQARGRLRALLSNFQEKG